MVLCPRHLFHYNHSKALILMPKHMLYEQMKLERIHIHCGCTVAKPSIVSRVTYRIVH